MEEWSQLRHVSPSTDHHDAAGGKCRDALDCLGETIDIIIQNHSKRKHKKMFFDSPIHLGGESMEKSYFLYAHENAVEDDEDAEESWRD